MTDAEITCAYRRLVRHLHPDADNDVDPHALEQVVAAYQLLRAPERRAAHDRERVRASRKTGTRAETTTGDGTTGTTTGTTRTVPPTRHDAPISDVPVRHHPSRRPDLRAGPVRRHR